MIVFWAPVHYSIIVFKNLCTHVPEGYFRATFFRLLQGVQQIGSRIETKGRKQKKKKLLLVEFIWLANFPHGHNDCVERRQFSGAEFQVPSEV